MIRLAICFFYLVFGNGITCLVMPLLPAVLSCFGCVVLRCVMLCSVVICRSRCVALRCVIALRPVVSLRWVVYCLLRCGVVEKFYLITLVMFY